MLSAHVSRIKQPEFSHDSCLGLTPLLQLGQEYLLPLDLDVRAAFCERLGGGKKIVGVSYFEREDQDIVSLDIKTSGMLWLSEFVADRSQDDELTYTTEDMLRFGFPANPSKDMLAPVQKHVKKLADLGLVDPIGGRTHRRYKVPPVIQAKIKYTDSLQSRSVKPSKVYRLDLV